MLPGMCRRLLMRYDGRVFDRPVDRGDINLVWPRFTIRFVAARDPGQPLLSFACRSESCQLVLAHQEQVELRSTAEL